MKLLISICIMFTFGLSFAGPLSPQDSLSKLAAPATVDNIFFNYANSTITSATYTEVLSATTKRAGSMEIFDSSGSTLIFAVGAAASEVDKFLILPGGQDRVIFDLAIGDRISVKAKSTGETISTGLLIINFSGQQ